MVLTSSSYRRWTVLHSFPILMLLTCSITVVIMYFQSGWKTVWILIRWLLQKPADLDLQCFQKKKINPGWAGQGIMFVCLFDLILYVPVYNLSVTSGRVFLGWTSTKLGLMCLAQGHNAVTPVRLKPAALRSRVKNSTTEPLRSLRDNVINRKDIFFHRSSLTVWDQLMNNL